VNFQQHVALGGRQEIIWGLDYREAFYRPGEVAPLSATPVLNSAVPLSPANEALYDVFAEDQITLIPDKLQLIAGAHVSHNEFTGFDVQPTGRLLWTPNDKATTWLAISRAVRTPTLVEQYYDAIVAEEAIAPPLFAVVHLLGDPNFVSEIMVAYEAGQRVQIGRRISLDGSLFYNVYQHLSSVTAEAPVLMPGVGALPPYLEIPTLFGNYRYGESYGGEVSATWSVNSRWSLTAGANAILIHTRPYPGNVNTDSFLAEDSTPKHQFQVHSYFNLTRTIQIDTGIYYYSAMPVLGVPQYLRGDLRLGWRPTEKLEFSVGVQDAFEANHVEFLSSQFPQLEEVPRNFYGKVTWRF
jgi:iron complex outermembrane receptor protein